jgi:glycosyltransferase involved in cell wall biosynthesis
MTTASDNFPPRVLLFTDSDAFAGTERHILDLACGLRAQRVEVSVACPEPSILADHLHRDDLPHVAIQKAGTWDRAAIRTLRQLLVFGKIDIIHAHNGRTALIAAMAVRSAGRGQCVATQHFISPNHAGHRGFKKLISSAAHRWVNRRVAAHVAISQAVRQAAADRGEMSADRIHLVPNGIGDPTLGTRRPVAEIRAELGIPAAALLLVCAARLEAEKNVGDLIEAMRSVVRAIPSAVCVVAGEGAQRKALEELCRREGLESNVKMPGFRADAISLIDAADVFVLPSAAEAFGLVLVEAMALAKPVVAIKMGGPVEIILDGQTGLLVPPADPPALGAAIVRLLANPQERAMMGQMARRRYESHFTQERMARDMVHVYRSIQPT